MGIIDRTYEKSPEDPIIKVTLDGGFVVTFWATGLTDKECIKRTKVIQESEVKKALKQVSKNGTL